MSQPQAAPVACSAFYGRSYPAPYVAPDGSVRAAYGGVIGPLAAWAGRAAFGRGGYAADVASAKVHGGAGALLGGARARTLSGAAPLRRARAIDTLAKARAVRAGRVYKKAPGGAGKSKAAQTPRSKAEELKARVIAHATKSMAIAKAGTKTKAKAAASKGKKIAKAAKASKAKGKGKSKAAARLDFQVVLPGPFSGEDSIELDDDVTDSDAEELGSGPRGRPAPRAGKAASKAAGKRLTEKMQAARRGTKVGKMQGKKK